VSRASQRNALLTQHCYSPYGTTQLEKTIKNRQKGAFWAKTGSFGYHGSPEEARCQVKMCIDHESDQLVAVRTKSGNSWPSEDLLSPLKGVFWAKTGRIGVTGGPEGSRCRVGVCGGRGSSPGGPVGDVGTKSGPPGPSEDLLSPQKGCFGPKRALLGPWGPRRVPIPGQSVWWP
jgi:hypothetical protein